MDKTELLRKIQDYGILKDPQWLDRLDDPTPLWVIVEMLIQLIERLEPPNGPYD
ncbi:hypothetical protein ACFSL6_16205 [Paenibacillus thailandensis]|uniref:Transposase n=1 Tax=Paenibacillus thailandensis TaxID=393250 RepID=A0ABW5QTK7_9BACL